MSASRKPRVESNMLDRPTPRSEPPNWVVKNNPAWASVRFQRAMKTGRIGPRMVQVIPVMMKPAKRADWINFGAWVSLVTGGSSMAEFECLTIPQSPPAAPACGAPTSTPDTGHRTPNTEHRTPNTEHRTPNTEHR